VTDQDNEFWREYRRLPVMGWLSLIGGVCVAVFVGVAFHFLPVPFGPQLANIFGIAFTAFGFFGSMYFFFKYRNAKCPHCHRGAARLLNIFFPITPVCPKCGRRMNKSDP
jgi:hypothetical protein